MTSRSGVRAGPDDTGPSGTRGAVVALRIVTSFAWLDSALIGKDAKFAPDFLSGSGLATRVSTTFVHTALVPAAVLREVVLPHAQAFAVAIALGDLAIGVSLLFGLFARAGGALCIARAIVNILIVGGAGADTVGYNAMLVTAGAIVSATHAGRALGVDGTLVERFPRSRLLRLLT